ncbi:Succinoglycan biosynthesis transport protein [Rhodovulum sp. P5]|uniref:GumC family protein n=1 Tax=Rhodovulum sp. P5 TaxID=1564506 RepID=UPI0009C3853E|nr:polysaccharide biosynthesis tyrosine autokinase [Rhodovulum sp. P5]ARE40856.1 Succinoglycan biosynthesis transport protein [Rhodovulum sp. P5]
MTEEPRSPSAKIVSRAFPQRGSDTTGEDVIDLSAVFGILWRGKLLILAFCVMAVIAGGFYAFMVATPLYRATAVVMLETRQEQIVDLQSVVGGLSGDTSEVNSEVEVLRARGLLGKVVDELDLVSDPEFNPTLQPPSPVERAKDGVKAALGLSKPPLPLPPEEATRRLRDSVISQLLRKISVRNIPQTLVFGVTAESESPEKAALIADTIVELYIVDQVSVKFEATEQATTWLSNRVAELQTELEKAEGAVKAFNAATDLVSPEALAGLERQMKEMRERIGSTREARDALKARYDRLTAAQSRPEQAALAEDIQLTRDLEGAAENPDRARAFDTRFGQILTRMEMDLVRADQQLAALEASKQDLTAQIEQQGQDLITLQQLSREAEATRLLYEYFLARLKETSAQQGIQQPDSRILSNAVVPLDASSPKKGLILMMSAFVGVVAGSAMLFLKEARSTGFRTARELEAHTGYTVMGQIPVIPAKARSKILSYLTDKPTSAAAEAVRNLRTSVLLSNVDNPPQVIVSTSSIPGEGKTTNALALAHNLLGLGKSVLLVEGDIRRRTLNRYFDRMPERGIVSVLAGEVAVEDAVYHAPGFGADVLAGERTKVNAADLFASQRFRDFIKTLRSQYDAIIIDTPPVLVVPDARIIAREADTVLFTVKWDGTSKAQVDEAMRMFHNTNQHVNGLILSQISPKGMKRYGYGERYGAYAGYGDTYYSS